MKLETKIIITILAVGILLLVTFLSLTKYFLKEDLVQGNDLPVPNNVAPAEIIASPFEMDEGFTVDLPSNWELIGTEPERSVDRYRFERMNSEGILTVSFYDQYSSFDEVIDARYGGGFIDQITDLTVHDFPAKRLTSTFLDFGNSIDVIIQTGDGAFVSVYGTQIPQDEKAVQIVTEVDSVQMSFRPQ